MWEILLLVAGAVFLFFSTLFLFALRYKRCPSDKVLVVYGKVGEPGISAKCYHGGAAFIWPVLQAYEFLELTPIPIDIKLEGALSQQNIRINTPSTFMVGISTEPGVMENAAERLLGLTLEEVRQLARDIIFGQMRVVIATMPIEEINADRDQLIKKISEGVEVELKKVGLRLINVNIQDITDESGYIDALGKEAAARAINEAKIKVAQQERDGEIGRAEAERDQRIRVAEAGARATEGENLSGISVARSNASRREAEAESERAASAAEKVKSAQALQEAYTAEQQAEHGRAAREEATQYANIVVPAEIEKKRIETIAEAEAEQERRLRRGEADGKLSLMEAEAKGVMAILTRKADGLREIIGAAGGSPERAALMLITEQLPELVRQQVQAIANLKIDSVTVWDQGRGADGGKGGTAGFLSGLVESLPPLHQLTKNVGLELPEYLGKLTETPEAMRELGERLKRESKRLTARQAAARTWLESHQQKLEGGPLASALSLEPAGLEEAAVRAAAWAAKTSGREAVWYVLRDGETAGPVSWAEACKEGAEDSPVQLEGSGKWLPRGAVQKAAEA